MQLRAARQPLVIAGIAIFMIFVASIGDARAAIIQSHSTAEISPEPGYTAEPKFFGIDLKGILLDIAGNKLASTTSASTTRPSLPAINGISSSTAEGLFEKFNDWFRGITGIGLDQIISAIWRLLVWIITTFIRVIEVLAAWIAAILGRLAP